MSLNLNNLNIQLADFIVYNKIFCFFTKPAQFHAETPAVGKLPILEVEAWNRTIAAGGDLFSVQSKLQSKSLSPASSAFATVIELDVVR